MYIGSEQTELAIKLPMKKNSQLDGFAGQFCQTLKEEEEEALIPHKLFPKIRGGRTFTN